MEPIIEETITITPESFTKLVHYVAGAVSAVFMIRDPELDFATVADEVKTAAVNGVDGWMEEKSRLDC